MPLSAPVIKLRVDQLGVEVLGQYIGTGHLRVNQLGVEYLGPWTGHKLRVDQLGCEVLAGSNDITNNLRLNQLGIEALVVQRPTPHGGSGSIRLTQLGVEVLRSLSLPEPAGDTTGHEYYVGPGFGQGIVPEKQPSSYEPQWGDLETLTMLGNLINIGMTTVFGTVSNVPLTGTTPLQVQFVTPFTQVCGIVLAVYVPQNGDSTGIFVRGETNPGGVTPTVGGFEILGSIVSGSSTNTTGTFLYLAVGV